MFFVATAPERRPDGHVEPSRRRARHASPCSTLLAVTDSSRTWTGRGAHRDARLRLATTAASPLIVLRVRRDAARSAALRPGRGASALRPAGEATPVRRSAPFPPAPGAAVRSSTSPSRRVSLVRLRGPRSMDSRRSTGRHPAVDLGRRARRRRRRSAPSTTSRTAMPSIDGLARWELRCTAWTVTALRRTALMHAERVRRVRARMAELGVDVLLLSVGADLPYLTGYEAMPLERLTMLVLPARRRRRARRARGSRRRGSSRAARPVRDRAVGRDRRPDRARRRASVGRRGAVAIGDHTWARFVLALQDALPDARVPARVRRDRPAPRW